MPLEAELVGVLRQRVLALAWVDVEADIDDIGIAQRVERFAGGALLGAAV